MFQGDALANLGEEFRGVFRLEASFNFLNQNEFLVVLIADQERAAAVHTKDRGNMLRGNFDILRIDVHAADNHHIFNSARYEELAVFDEAKIPGAKERTFICSGDTRAETTIRFLFVAPISLSDAWARRPNLPDSSVRTFDARLGIDDRKTLSEDRATARNKLTGARRTLGNFDGATFAKRQRRR